jgi:primary-amine oxidase
VCGKLNLFITPNPRGITVARLIILSVAVYALTVMAPFRGAAEPVRHPLDALTAPEYWAVFETMKASGKLDAASRYAGIELHEPPKTEVLQWKSGDPFRREALAIIKQGRRTFEALVDVANRKLISWKEIKGVEPVLIADETGVAEERVKSDPQWQAAMRKRGITDFDTVGCGGDSPGYFGTPEEQGRRLQRIRCSDKRGFQNGGAHPIEGLIVVWDSEEQKVIRVIDTGVVPVPPGNADYDATAIAARDVPGPISVQQPVHGFRVNGTAVSWQNWNFHFRIDPKMGVVVTNVGYDDGGKTRTILYEGSLAEVFVPYQDPAEGWYYISFIDMGEANVWGGVASVLEPGADCPDNAVYFDSVTPTSHGTPERWPRTACLFEREAGDFAWRHAPGGHQPDSRRQRDLVLRMITTFGNYDYAVDWTFQQNGSIKIGVGATGSVEIKAVRSRTAAEDRDGRDRRYGHFVADNTVAVNHDHYFCFRLDLDIDGTENSFLKEDLKTERLPADNPRKSVWVAEPKIAKVEEEAQLRMMMEHPALWRVINPNVKGPLGYPVSYQIAPSHNAMSLMTDDDYPQRRAGFIRHNLWVTPYREDERYPAGDYPTQSHGGDGLPAWTKANRPIENTDIVVWYTLGFHHVPRPEDWPIMPTAWHEFELRPFDFFARNPAVDLPKVR